MAKKYLVNERHTSIIYFDDLILSFLLSKLIFEYTSCHWSIAFVVFLILYVGFLFLFLTFRIFRYVASILFSLFYAFIVGYIFHLSDEVNPYTPAIVFGILAFLLSLFLHKDHFDFLNDSEYIEYDKF